MSPTDPGPLVALAAALGAMGAAIAAATLTVRRRRGSAAVPPPVGLDQVIAERAVRRARLPASPEVTGTAVEARGGRRATPKR